MSVPAHVRVGTILDAHVIVIDRDHAHGTGFERVPHPTECGITLAVVGDGEPRLVREVAERDRCGLHSRDSRPRVSTV